MGDGLLYLKDYLTEEDMTFDFTPEFEGDKVKGVTVAVYEGRLEADELEETEPVSLISLDAEGWATLLSWVRAVMEAKRIK
jgi:hypothetical protein